MQGRPAALGVLGVMASVAKDGGNGQAKASGGSWKLPDWLVAVLALGLVLLALKLWNEYQLRREEDLYRFSDV